MSNDQPENTVEAIHAVEMLPTAALAPYYKSVKIVQALRIVSIETCIDPNQAMLHCESINTGRRYAPINISQKWIEAKEAKEGGVYVIYADGYVSYCPLDVFERGNLPLNVSAEQIVQRLMADGHINNHTPDVDMLKSLRHSAELATDSITPYDLLRHKLLNDDDYAWSWHCNIAMTMDDEGIDSIAANKAACRLMKHLFKVDTSETMKKYNGIEV